MRYKDYDIDDFLTDEFFIQWIKNPDENNRHFWEKWLEQHPEKREVVMEAKSVISSIHHKNKTVFDDKLYVETFENIVRAKKPGDDKQGIGLNKQSWYFGFPFRQMAASVLILFCFGMVYQIGFHPPKSEELIKNEISIIKRTNPAGKKSIITLSDGTKIFLNAESEISYTHKFSDSLRLVSLKGEAYFEVQKEARPFVVETEDTKIQVLGTSFNVNQKDNGSLMVALVTGKVRINDQQGNEVNLEPSEMLVREEGGDIYKRGFDPLEITGWKDKVLVFKSNSFPEVEEKISNWFGVNIQFKGKIDSNWTYSGIYKDESLENVLRGISLTSGLSYKIENKKKVTIINQQ